MLKGVDPVIGPDLLAILRAMGHGDEIVIADANFPASSLARRLVRADGVDAAHMVGAIAQLLPLDDFCPAAAFRMAVVDAPTTEPPIVPVFSAILAGHGYEGPIEALERFDFYDRAREAFAIVATGERRLYGNLILKKGVLRTENDAAQ
jgi:L-fucose mutarotase